MKKQNLIMQGILTIWLLYNKNGLWIKENFKDVERIITATQPRRI